MFALFLSFLSLKVDLSQHLYVSLILKNVIGKTQLKLNKNLSRLKIEIEHLVLSLLSGSIHLMFPVD